MDLDVGSCGVQFTVVFLSVLGGMGSFIPVFGMAKISWFTGISVLLRNQAYNTRHKTSGTVVMQGLKSS